MKCKAVSGHHANIHDKQVAASATCHPEGALGPSSRREINCTNCKYKDAAQASGVRTKVAFQGAAPHIKSHCEKTARSIRVFTSDVNHCRNSVCQRLPSPATVGVQYLSLDINRRWHPIHITSCARIRVGCKIAWSCWPHTI